MSRQFRYRVTAIVLGGLIFGAPMLANGTASAEQVRETGRQVTFEGGGMLGLSCRSEPDTESMVVPADSTVRVVNRTGYSAKLLLSGNTKGTLPDDTATEVVFRRGTTAVSLKPNCAIGDDATPVLVTASPSASATMPDPTPAPSDAGPAAVTAAPNDSDAPSGAGSGQPAGSSTADRPARVPHAGTHRPGTTRIPPTGGTSMPQGAADPRLKPKTKVRAMTRTPGSRAPAFAGMPPGDQKAIVAGVPTLDVVPLSQAAAPAAVPPPPTEVAVAEPMATVHPMPGGGPIGMLALIAAVCVLGVGAAAIRAIVSQRANRAKMA